MNVFHRFFFFLAASIVLLHNFMPHDHCTEKSGDGHQDLVQEEINDLLDPFWLVFHEDVQGNLEHILPAASCVFFLIDDCQFPVVADFSLLTPVKELVVFSVEKSDSSLSDSFGATSRQRGPPAC